VILKFQFTYLEDLQQILYNYVRTMSPDPFLEINFNFCHFTLLNCVGTDKTRDSCQYMSIKTMVSWAAGACLTQFWILQTLVFQCFVCWNCLILLPYYIAPVLHCSQKNFVIKSRNEVCWSSDQNVCPKLLRRWLSGFNPSWWTHLLENGFF
jgi:hypothetical protein